VKQFSLLGLTHHNFLHHPILFHTQKIRTGQYRLFLILRLTHPLLLHLHLLGFPLLFTLKDLLQPVLDSLLYVPLHLVFSLPALSFLLFLLFLLFFL